MMVSLRGVARHRTAPTGLQPLLAAGGETARDLDEPTSRACSGRFPGGKTRASGSLK